MNAERAAEYEKSDPTFVADLRESESTVWQIAQYLQRRGHHVTVRALKIRESVEDMGEFGDSGDLEILQRVEVKKRAISFTSKQDFPYPSIIVDVAHAWDRAQPKPYAYFLVNQEDTHCAIVLGSSSQHWEKVERMDNKKNRVRRFYECPIAHVTFRDLRG